jgi:acetylornithine/N-succinyldiaminopimelate aminotransferase
MPASSPHVMPTYGRLPIALSHGQGVYVWDTDNRRYLDALGGIAVNTLGHAHPELVAALREQVGQLIHCSNYYHITHQEALAAELVRLSGMTNVFFCSSGLEANEAAIKIARKFGHAKGIERPSIVVYEHAFHGRSLATLSATGNTKIQQGFGPMVEGFVRVPINRIEALREVAQQQPNVVAVFFEAIQGEGGVHPLDESYMREVRALCDANDWLLMIDEVQCGIGRTGKWFAHQWADIVPDVMPLAKGLGSGVPIGAVVAGPRAAKVLGPGDHGSTFGGNPLATRAGVETLRIMQAQGLLQNAAEVGGWMLQTLRQQLQDVAGVANIRGKGLMIGIELDRPCGALVQQAADAGLLISVTAERVVRMVPPLILTQAQAQEIIETLCPLIKTWLQTPSK